MFSGLIGRTLMKKDVGQLLSRVPDSEKPGIQSVDVGSAPTGYGEYDQLFASNPYRNLNYKKSAWQNLLEGLGFRTSYDDYVEQAQVNAQEYDAGIFSMIQQNQFNSPAAQADRMRAAGLNPDLQGLGDVAGAASPTEDPNGMQPEGAGEAEQVAGVVTRFASNMISAFSTGVQIFQNMANIRKIKADINSIAINNADRIVDVVDKIIVGSVPLSVIEKGDNVDSYLGNVDMSQYGFTGAGLTAANQAFKDRFDSIKNNADIRKHVYQRYGAISDTYKVASEGFIPSDQMPSSPDELFNIQTECLSRAARRIMSLAQANKEFDESVLIPTQQANESLMQGIEQDKLATLSDAGYGSAEAANLIQGTESDTFLKQAQRILNEERATMYSILKVKAQSGDSLASAVLHAMALQDMMQVDFSSDLDLSFLKGLSNLAGSLFTFGSKGSSSTESAADTFKRSFGSGLTLHLGVRTK